MSFDPHQVLLRQALVALSKDRPEEAIEILDRIGGPGENIPDQLAYRGLAEAKLGHNDRATELLRRAVVLDPGQARFNYSLAMHLKSLGQVEEAKTYAEAARVRDSRFPGLQELMVALGMEIPDPRLRFRERLLSPLPRPPEGPIHAFPAIEQNEALWTRLGWFFVAINVLGLVLFWLHSPAHPAVKGHETGLAVLGGLVPNSDPLSVLAIFVFVTDLILCCAWTLVDMVDRRANAVWFVPMIPFCCLCAMPGIGTALYMSIGRKVVNIPNST